MLTPVVGASAHLDHGSPLTAISRAQPLLPSAHADETQRPRSSLLIPSTRHAAAGAGPGVTPAERRALPPDVIHAVSTRHGLMLPRSGRCLRRAVSSRAGTSVCMVLARVPFLEFSRLRPIGSCLS
jgi:hypothetical protein